MGKSWVPNPEQRQVLTTILSMTTDSILGRGTDNVETFVSNLKAYCGMLEKRK